MVGINFLNYLDRWVAAAAAPLIQKEFHIDDAQVGLLGTAFLLVYAVAALPFGYWSDRGVRRTVIGVGVTIWSLATLFSGLAANYVQLFLSRAAVGIGEASYYPAGTSLVSDFFPKEHRGRVRGRRLRRRPFRLAQRVLHRRGARPPSRVSRLHHARAAAREHGEGRACGEADHRRHPPHLSQPDAHPDAARRDPCANRPLFRAGLERLLA